MSRQCQGALIGDCHVNFLDSWPHKPRWYGRCAGTATHRVVAGCVHEHVLAWDACTDCAAKVRRQIAEDRKPQCVTCHRDHVHICPVLVQIEELPAAGAA